MSLALQKTLAFLLLIGIGVLLKRKISSKEQLGGIKVLILSIALPATIFVALLKIEIAPELLFLPLLALLFNGIAFFGGRAALPVLGVAVDSSAGRTLSLLLPSLAPGLSCFPFVAEYLGNEQLAQAALADVGNKVFVLIVLYLLAMHWYYRRRTDTESISSSRGRIKDLLVSLASEPVNLVIVTALILLGLGLNMTALPGFLQDAIGRMSALMTPMILLFIGMAVRVQRKQIGVILRLLAWRSGLAFLLSGLFLFWVPTLSPAAALLAIAFPQSACSFWPFAHLSAVNSLESRDQVDLGQRTFDLDLGLNVLAFSLPFSTIIILSLFSAGPVVAQPTILFGLAVALILIATLPLWTGKRKPITEVPTTSKAPTAAVSQLEVGVEST